MINAEVEGFKALEASLNKLESSLAPKVLRASLRKGGELVKDKMQQGARQSFETQTGVLAESIKVKTTLNKRQNHKLFDAAVYVGVYNVKALQRAAGRDIPANLIAYWIETGVKPHDLNAKSKRSRGKVGEGVNNFHPGFAAQPFIRPALLNNTNQVIDVTRAELKKQVNRAIKKANGKKR